MKSSIVIALRNNEKRQELSQSIRQLSCPVSVSKPEVTMAACLASCLGLGRLAEKRMIGAELI